MCVETVFIQDTHVTRWANTDKAKPFGQAKGQDREG